MIKSNENKIKSLLLQRGFEQKDVAAETGKSPALVSLVITGKHRNKQIEDAIARLCKKSVCSLFPYRRLHIWQVLRNLPASLNLQKKQS